jgi:Uma2 family endonuclease
MAPQTSIKLTYEDYLAIPDDGRRHEIIDGVHYVSPSPTFRHQLIVATLIRILGNHVAKHDLGWVVGSPCDVLSEHTIVQRDVLFISKARAFIIDKTVNGAPDLVVEVLSSNREYDERTKFQEYEVSGVLESWIVDPESESVKVFRRAGNKFAAVPVTDTLTTPLLPGFTLRVADLFA